MQIKTISKNIKFKLNEWLETITDASLRSKVKNNILVSGGSITSMMLNEPINDYDIYLKDRNVLLDLVKYYTNPYSSLLEILQGQDKEQLLSSLKYTDNSYGAALRNMKDDQIKLYIQGGNGGIRVNEDKKPEELNYTPLFFSPNAISLSNDLQIVIRFFGDAEAIHKTFDFIHATNYFTFEEGLVTNKEALQSIISKQLSYQGSLYPVTSVIRAKKFVKRGWNINAGEYLKMMFQVSELNLQDTDVLDDQLLGLDVAFFDALIRILRDVKEKNPDFKLTPQYFNTIINKVFNEDESDE